MVLGAPIGWIETEQRLRLVPALDERLPPQTVDPAAGKALMDGLQQWHEAIARATPGHHATVASGRHARSASEGRAACAALGTARGAAYVFDPTRPKPGRPDDETLMTDGRQKLTRLGIQLLALTVEDFS